MDKNTAIGLVLIVLVFIGFTYWGQPSKEEQERYKRQQDSIELAKQQEANIKLNAAQQQKAKAEAAAADTNSVLYAARNGKAQDVVLKNDKVELTLSTKGGVFKKAVLKNYKDQQGNADLTLFDAQKGETTLNFAFAGKDENIRTEELFFTPVNASDKAVTLRLETAKGHIDFNYSLNEYMVNLDIQAVGMDGFFAPSAKTVNLEWMELARQQEKGFTFENQRSSLTYKEKGESSDYLSETKDDAEDVKDATDWIAFKNQFFSA
ncbi:MAG: membrane protein insertase YidC, partial [Bacteroidaceae bacterium]|nr:membrane protein insertase YidC [Bacteroidaceae bacterium]